MSASEPIGGGGGGGGSDLPTSDDISTSYEVEGGELVVDVVFDPPGGGLYSGDVTVSYDGGGSVVRNIQQIDIPLAGAAEPTVYIPLDDLGVSEGVRTEVLVTIVMDGPDGPVQQQEYVEVTWGTPQVDVSILNVEQTSNTLDVTVSVSTETVATIDYTININDSGTGGTTDRSGTLEGGSGSNPGDAVTHSVEFGVGDVGGGTVTAQFTSPAEYAGIQDQAEWGQTFAKPNVEIAGCNTPFPLVNPDDTLNYSVDLLNKNPVQANVRVGFLLNGTQVGENTFGVTDERNISIALPESDFRQYADETPEGYREYRLGVELLDISEG